MKATSPLTVSLVASLALSAGSGLAQPTGDAPPKAELVAPVTPAPAAAPVLLPFGLRGVGVGNAVRLDQTFASYTASDKAYQESVHFLSAAVKVGDSFAVSLRTGFDRYGQPDRPTTTGFLNTVVAGQYSVKLAPTWRFAAVLGAGLPTASGAGNNPDPDVAAAHKAGNLARGLMNGVMFTPNEIYALFGADLAFVARGFTAQIEVTVAPGARVRGEVATPDATKVNSVNGLALGYYVIPQLSVGAELWYQRWLSTPASVEKDSSLRDALSLVGGVRGHIDAGGFKVRPGVSYGVGVRGTLADKHVHMLQLDVPVSF
ncbi:MAG: hypothetical protein JNL79_02050 [Myxococcales bacterium]|nr:hypothetical protein [Myxococcales bacterium]